MPFVPNKRNDRSSNAPLPAWRQPDGRLPSMLGNLEAAEQRAPPALAREVLTNRNHKTPRTLLNPALLNPTCDLFTLSTQTRQLYHARTPVMLLLKGKLLHDSFSNSARPNPWALRQICDTWRLVLQQETPHDERGFGWGSTCGKSSLPSFHPERAWPYTATKYNHIVT